MNRELDVAAGQRLFGDGVSLFTGFDLCSLHGVRLEKLIEFGLLAPTAVVIVELQLAAAEMADDWVSPAVQFDGEAVRRRCE